MAAAQEMSVSISIRQSQQLLEGMSNEVASNALRKSGKRKAYKRVKTGCLTCK